MVKIILLKTLRDLRASFTQSLALVVIVALGVASLIALVGAYRDLGTSYNHTYDQLHFADITFSLRAAPQTIVDEIAKVNGVAAVTGRLSEDSGLELPASVTGSSTEEIRTRLIGIDAAQHPAVNDVHILAGRFLNASDSQAALLESHFANVYNLHPGDKVTPFINGNKISLDVVGIAASPEYLVVSPSKQEIIPSARNFAVLFVPLKYLQSQVSAAGMINEIAIRFVPGANPDAVINAVRAKLDAYGVLATTLRKDEPSNAALQLDLDGYRELSNLMPALILLVAAASVYVMLGRLVRGQQPQIGVMKALGYNRRAIVLHYVAFALVIGVLGSLLGIALGIPLANQVTTDYAGELGIPLVESRVYLDLIFGGVALSLVASALAGVGPAWSAAQVPPAEAMRFDPSTALVKGRTTLLERVIRLPFWLRLPVRNVFRVWRRSISTGLGVIFAFVLILMAWGLIDSMNYLLDTNFHAVERWDVTASFNSPQTSETLKTIQSWQGVRQVEPLIQLPASLQVGSQKEDILLTAFAPAQTMHTFRFAETIAPAQALADGKIVLSTGLANKYNLRVGDAVSLQTPFGTHSVTVSALSNELMSASGFVSLAQAQQWTGAPLPVWNALDLTVDPNRADQIRSDLYGLPDAASVQLKTGIESDWRSLMGLFYVFMGVIALFALVMSFALLFNAMTANVLERQREFATMRAVGTGSWRIALLVSAENVILWLLALAPGLWLGTLVAAQLGTAVGSDLFSLQVVVSPSSYILSAVVILLTMLLAALPAIRRINRLNLAEATKVLA